MDEHTDSNGLYVLYVTIRINSLELARINHDFYSIKFSLKVE